MTLTDAKLRLIVNQLADAGTAHAAAHIISEEAKRQGKAGQRPDRRGSRADRGLSAAPAEVLRRRGRPDRRFDRQADQFRSLRPSHRSPGRNWEGVAGEDAGRWGDVAPAIASRTPRRGCGRTNHFFGADLACKKERLPMTETSETMTSPLREATRRAADAMARFPGDSDDAKERRALKAALHVAEIRDQFSTVTAARFHLERLFNVSERQIRRAEKILRFPEIVQLVLKGPVSVTNAAHVIEHAGVDMLKIAWACAGEAARREFCEQLRKEGLV